jgi:uncharacterized protein (TIGR02145 family)
LKGPRGKVANKLKADSLWKINDKDLNISDFTAIPSSFYDARKKAFYELGVSATFWSLEVDKNTVWCRTLLGDKQKINRENCARENAYSVRCIKK